MATRAQGEVPGNPTPSDGAVPLGGSRQPPGPNPSATGGAPGNAVPAASEPDVDAFLRESPRALTGHYWDPVDSLVPVRLLDMRDEPAPAEPRRKVRGMDLVIGAVGVAAVAMLALSVFKNASAGAAVVAHAPTERAPARVAAAPASPPAMRASPRTEATTAVAVSAPVNATTTEASAVHAEAPPAGTTPEPVGGKSETPPPGAKPEPATATGPAVAATAEASAATPDVASVAASEPARPKKRRPKPSAHTPPTASFPD